MRREVGGWGEEEDRKERDDEWGRRVFFEAIRSPKWGRRVFFEAIRSPN